MTAQQIRESFLKYFEKHGHIRKASSSLLPDNDPSVLLTTAGMQQFKPYFLAERDPIKDLGGKRMTTVQKCFRTSDIDEIGDTSHLTFFEMLGNFSFGDYWKTETIDMAWEFLTKTLGLDKNRLWVTVFAGEGSIPRDQEAEVAWKKHLPAERIVHCGRKDNFWGPPGKSGSCGPSSEIHWQLVDDPKGKPNESPEFIEIWNLVFTEYKMDEAGTLTPLPQKNIDTGMGLERLAMVVQGKTHVYETDLYVPIIAATEQIEGFGDSENPTETARRLRIIADHIRGATFLLADGVQFSNKDQGYILRRIVRRAADQFLRSDANLLPLADAVIEHFGAAYPELHANSTNIHERMRGELMQYKKVLDVDVMGLVKKMRKGNDVVSEVEPATGPSHILLTPDEAFILFTTHGISLDRLARLGFGFERTAVEERITAHQEQSRAGAEKKFGGHGLSDEAMATSDMPEADKKKITRLHTATHLLHAALRQILGPEVKQMGSDITPERLRFDFTFHRKLTDEEKLAIEMLVNQKINDDLPVSWKMMKLEEALESGAMAFFREKYPPEVKVYSVGDFSKELCGGPHVTHTSEVGPFKLTAEQSIGSGLRRVKGGVT